MMQDRDRLADIDRQLAELRARGHASGLEPGDAPASPVDDYFPRPGTFDPECASCRETRELSQERARFWETHDRRRTDRRQNALDTRVTPERRRAHL